MVFDIFDAFAPNNYSTNVQRGDNGDNIYWCFTIATLVIRMPNANSGALFSNQLSALQMKKEQKRKERKKTASAFYLICGFRLHLTRMICCNVKSKRKHRFATIRFCVFASYAVVHTINSVQLFFCSFSISEHPNDAVKWWSFPSLFNIHHERRKAWISRRER